MGFGDKSPQSLRLINFGTERILSLGFGGPICILSNGDKPKPLLNKYY